MADKHYGDPQWGPRRPSLPLTAGRMLLASSSDIWQRRQSLLGSRTPYEAAVADWKEGCSCWPWSQLPWSWGPMEGGMSQTVGVFSTWEWTPPDSWQENGALHSSTTRIWILAAVIWAWKRTQALEKTLHRHLLAAWWDPGQGTQLSAWIPGPGQPWDNKYVALSCCLG